MSKKDNKRQIFLKIAFIPFNTKYISTGLTGWVLGGMGTTTKKSNNLSDLGSQKILCIMENLNKNTKNKNNKRMSFALCTPIVHQ